MAAPPLPQLGAGTMPGQPPFGSSPATSPTPDRGSQVKALSQLRVAVRILEMLVPTLGAGSEPGQAVLKAITTLSKFVPPGSTAGGVEKNTMQDLLMQQAQQSPMMAAMKAMGQGGPTGSGMPLPQMPGAGGPPAAPAPSGTM